MKKKLYIGLAAIYITFMTAIGYNASLALFTDSASSTSNTFAAAVEFPSATPTATPTPAHVVINEVFQTAAASGEWVELYNTTGSPIDVSGWSVADNEEPDPFPSVSPIPTNGYAVVVPTGSTATVPGSAITIQLADTEIGGSLAQGGDKIVLTNSSSTIIDAMSWGSNSDIFPTPVPSPAAGKSMSRMPNGTDTNSNSDWQLDSSPTIGTVNN